MAMANAGKAIGSRKNLGNEKSAETVNVKATGNVKNVVSGMVIGNVKSVAKVNVRETVNIRNAGANGKSSVRERNGIMSGKDAFLVNVKAKNAVNLTDAKGNAVRNTDLPKAVWGTSVRRCTIWKLRDYMISPGLFSNGLNTRTAKNPALTVHPLKVALRKPKCIVKWRRCTKSCGKCRSTFIT